MTTKKLPSPERGTISDIRVWERELSPAEVATLAGRKLPSAEELTEWIDAQYMCGTKAVDLVTPIDDRIREFRNAVLEDLMVVVDEMEIGLCAHSQKSVLTRHVSEWVNLLKARIRKLREEP